MKNVIKDFFMNNITWLITMIFLAGGLFVTLGFSQSKIVEIENKFTSHEKDQQIKMEQMAIMASEWKNFREDFKDLKKDIKNNGDQVIEMRSEIKEIKASLRQR